MIADLPSHCPKGSGVNPALSEPATFSELLNASAKDKKPQPPAKP
jgi:hypothetical protein